MKVSFEMGNVTWTQVLALSACLAAIPVVYHYVGDHFVTAVCGSISTVAMAFVRRFGDPHPEKEDDK